jgi:uncharacterized tellurite resistance protein B-like protein
MTTRTHPGSEAEGSDLVAGIRNALAELEAIDSQHDGTLRSIALLLNRVADADGSISSEEVDRMEAILADHAAMSRPEAVLTVEIARHCARLADCGCTYEASRRLRTGLRPSERERLRGWLEAVAEADGLVQPSEQAAIRQIAAEIGVP